MSSRICSTARTASGPYGAKGKPPLQARLRRCLLAVAVAAATIISAPTLQAVPPAQAAATAAKVATQPSYTPAVSALITAPGAVYLSRSGTTLQAWAVDADAGTVTRQAAVHFDPASDQVVEINLGDAVTGLFFADNLRQDGDAYRLSFRGDLPQGGAAMPLKADALAPLWDVTVPDEVVVVAPAQTDLLALIDTQRAIYQRVADVTTLRQTQVEQFRADIGQELADAYTTHLTEGAYGQALIEDSGAAAQELHDRFLALVNDDLQELQGAADAISTHGLQEIARYEGPVTRCILGEVDKIKSQMATLERSLTPSSDDESYNAQQEALIESAEIAFQRNEANLLACTDSAGLENYEPGVGVDENAGSYEQIAAAAQALLDDIEPRVEAWRVKLETAGLARGARIENATHAADAMAVETFFSEWASPAYTADTDPPDSEAPELPSLRNKRAEENQTAEHNAQLKLETGEFCGDESWNLQFSLGSLSVVIATPWDDKIVTQESSDIILALNGDDCIESHAGYDVILAGRGDDTVYAGDDHDFVFGGRGEDEIHGGAGNSYSINIGGEAVEFDLGNLLSGGADNDRIFGGEVAADPGEDGEVDEHGFTDIIFGDWPLWGGAPGNDFIDGERGIDFLFGQQGDDQIVNLVPGAVTVAGLDITFGSYFFGGPGNDTLIGSDTTVAGNGVLLGDFMFGNEGNDIINANAGLDFIFGSDGNDRIDAGAGMDFAFGSAGNDNITGNDGLDLLTGNDGDDIVRGAAGLDLVFGGAGNDTLFGDDGLDLIFGRDGNDTIQGGNGFDLILGGDGGDVIDGNAATDIVLGGRGEDRINGGDGIDLLIGQQESDVIRGGSGTDVILGNDNTEKKPEELFGEAGIDLIFGGNGIDLIDGGADTDLIFGNRDNDVIVAGDGMDLAFGNDGNDTISGNDGLDLLFGGAGDDSIDGGAGTDLIFGGSGKDVISGGDGLDLLFGGDDQDKINGGNDLDIAFGGGAKDEILGGSGADFLFGGDDNDYLAGESGFDILLGQSGDDFLLGGADMDVMLAGGGNDFARGDGGLDIIMGGDGSDTLDGGDDMDLILGGEDKDCINSGNGTDITFGNKGDDKLRAVEGRNLAFGNKGNDTLDGYMSGSDTADLLFGNQDNDFLSGNSSNSKDWKFGGGGSDTKVNNQTHVPASLFNKTWGGNLACL